MVPKLVRGIVPGTSIFHFFFDHTCTFYLRNTYKCQKQFFQSFFKKLKEFIHTCTFYLRNTYKCAMTVFTILKKKLNEKNLMIFWIFGSLLAPFECQTSSNSCFHSIWFHYLLVFETIFVKK